MTLEDLADVRTALERGRRALEFVRECDRLNWATLERVRIALEFVRTGFDPEAWNSALDLIANALDSVRSTLPRQDFESMIADALQVGEEMLEDLAFEAADADGWEEVTEEELVELIAAGAVEVVPEFLRADARGASETRTYLTGPRGGVYYIAASGRKVYARKAPAGAEKTEKSQPAETTKRVKRTAEETRKARNERARTRRAEKKAEFERKQNEEFKRSADEAKRRHEESQERARRAKNKETAEHAVAPGPKTRAEATAALRKHVDNLVIGPAVRDHEVIDAYNELKKAGVEKIYGPGNKLPNLVLGATPIKGEHHTLPIDGISTEANGVYSNAQLYQGGQSYIKVSRNVRNPDAAEVERINERQESNLKASNVYLVGQGKPPLQPKGKVPLGGAKDDVLAANYKVHVEDHQELTRVLVHEFGHAVHLEPVGPHREIDAIVKRAYNESRVSVSGYGETNHHEYFAEAHVAYRYRREELRAHAPKAHKMVQDVLKLRGIES